MSLPWSLREQLAREIRGVVVEHGRGAHFGAVLANVIARVAKESKQPVLRALAQRTAGDESLEHATTRWAAAMPATRISEWLIGQISDAAGLVWEPEPADVAGPLRLPRSDRDKLERRFERLWMASISRHDDEPDADELADALEGEIARIGRRHEAFAVRVLTRRFPREQEWTDNAHAATADRQRARKERIRATATDRTLARDRVDLRTGVAAIADRDPTVLVVRAIQPR